MGIHEEIAYEAARAYIADIKAKDASGFPASVHYRRAKPNEGRCDGCRHFDAEREFCNLYKADASPEMTCDSFEPPAL